MTIGQFTRDCSGRYGAGRWHRHPTEPVRVCYDGPGNWLAGNGTELVRGPTMAKAVENLAAKIKEQSR
jgi:hypothetical protein